MIRINGIDWNIILVEPDDDLLWMGNRYTLGSTSPNFGIIAIANNLDDEMLANVLKHEICHATAFSMGIGLTIPMEECVCQIMERYGDIVSNITNDVLEML